MSWVYERRRHLQLLLTQALIGLGRNYRDRGEQREAIGLFIRALKETPTREDIHREVIQLYIDLGMPDDARGQYRRLEQMLAEAMDVGPSMETRALLEQI